MVWCDKLKNKMFCHLEKIFLFCFQLRLEFSNQFCFAFYPLICDLHADPDPGGLPKCGSGSVTSDVGTGTGAGGDKTICDLEPEPK